MTFTSYAQNFEDVMLLRALKDVKCGFYIDVGACAPDADSVTRLFYDQGWRGINIEPNPHYLRLLSEQRDGDKNLALALSDSEGMQTFHIIGDTGLSSLSTEIADKHAIAGMSSTEISVSVLTLQRLWADYIPAGCDVHFLKIDVEGLEASVIRGGDWTQHRPWIVVVEATAPASQEPSHKEWEPILLSHGYCLAYWDGLNRFYVADEHADLAHAFSAPPNVFDDFVLYSQVLLEQHATYLTTQLNTLVEESALLAGENTLLAGENTSLAETNTSLVETTASLVETNASLVETNASLVEEKASLIETNASLVEEGRAVNECLKKKQILLMHEQDKSHDLKRQVSYFKRPLWEKILFRETGRPVRLVRRALFHTSGKPRAIFCRIVLHKNGRPRRAFHEWMANLDYLASPGAVAGIYDLGTLDQELPTSDQEPPTSPRTKYFLGRIVKKTFLDGAQ